MDISLLLDDGMMYCGRVMKVLPQNEIKSPVEYMMKVIKKQTLPSLDILYPRLVKKTFPIYALTKVDDGDKIFNGGVTQSMDSRYAAFRVPDSLLDGCRMLGIRDYFESYGNSSGAENMYGMGLGAMYPNKWGRYSSAHLYSRSFGNMINYADSQLLGTMKPSIRMQYQPPNVLLINHPYCADEGMFITVEFKVGNDENLITVPDTAYERIRRLFILDLKTRIYNEYAMFSEIDTTTGNPVNLGISDWSSAESDRIQEFDTLQATAHFRNSTMRSG